MPLIWVRSSGAAAGAAAAGAAAAGLAALAFWLRFMRPCQSPLAAYSACPGQLDTLAGGSMSDACSARRICGSLASDSAA